MSNEKILLSPKHGVNASVTVCPVCGKEIGIAFLGKMPQDAEAPRRLVDREPCPECQKELVAHASDPDKFVFIVLRDEHDRSNLGRTPWQYFVAYVVARRQAVLEQLKDFPVEGGIGFIYESLARQMGVMQEVDEKRKKDETKKEEGGQS